MTPQRMAALVGWWVRRYTHGLSPPVARRRIEEIDADLYDHIAHERAQGTREGRIALRVLGRTLRGLAADASWRAGQARSTARPRARSHTVTNRALTSRSVVRVALATLTILLLPLVATLFAGASWGPFDFVLAAVLLAGIGFTLELAARGAGAVPPRTAVGLALGIAGVGVLAMVLGETDDAPGLVLIGILLVLAAITLAARVVQRSR